MLGQEIKTPANDVELRLMKAAQMRILVDCTGIDCPAKYLVGIVPESQKIGTSGRGRQTSTTRIGSHSLTSRQADMSSGAG